MDEESFHFSWKLYRARGQMTEVFKRYGMTFKLLYWLTPARLLIDFKAKEKLKEEWTITNHLHVSNSP